MFSTAIFLVFGMVIIIIRILASPQLHQHLHPHSTYHLLPAFFMMTHIDPLNRTHS